jgi:SNF2 family DNA or RNA helicase
MKWQAKPYQLQAVQHGLDCFARDGACALFLDPGLGKTSITLALFTVLKARGHVNALLVVAPRRAMLNTWPAEIAKWDQFKHLRVSLIHGTPEQRLAGLTAHADVYLIHYDNLERLANTLDGKPAPFDMLVCDESTKIKNPSTARFRALAPMRQRFAMRVALTGTPTPLHVGDLFGQIGICDGGARLGTKITHFRNEYMQPKWLPQVPVPTWEPQHDAEPRIFAALDGMALRLSSKEHLDMPELIHNTITVTMPDAVASLYRKFKRELYVELGGSIVTAAGAATASMKLRQMAGGVVYTDSGPKPVHPAKIDALLDLLEEQEGQPLLVATAFRSEVAHLQHILKGVGYGDVPALMGGVSDKYADKTINEWNEGKHRVLLCHPATTAHGLNLQAGGHAVCWFSLTFSLEEYIQFNARLWRQGQTSPHVIVHRIVAAGTIDSHIGEVLARKDARQESLFQALTRHMEGD